MLRPVETDPAPAGKPDLSDRTPSSFLNLGTRDAFLFQRGHLRLEIVTHEIKFVPIIFLVRMERSLCRRQGKNEPPVAGIHGFEPKNISEEGAIRRRVFAVHNDMRTEDHGSPFLAPPQNQLSFNPDSRGDSRPRLSTEQSSAQAANKL